MRRSSPWVAARVARVALASLASLACIAGCSSDGGGSATGFTCPSDLPSGCAPNPPSYAAEVAPLLARRCLGCHGDTGVASNLPLDTYVRVHQSRTTILTRVYGCQMPPAGETPLNAAERSTLLRWLVCDAPNN